MSQTTSQPTRVPPRAGRHPVEQKERSNRLWAWLSLGIPLLAIVALVAVGSWTFEPQLGLVGKDAPGFSLPTTLGTEVSLDGLLADGNGAMLYFSMGVGCDGCFAQIPEIEDALAERGIPLVSVMVDPADQVAAESARFGIDDPILIDQDRAVSSAYGMVGVYGHSDRPSHSFALVTRDREIAWVQHYASMFVPVEDFLADAGL